MPAGAGVVGAICGAAPGADQHNATGGAEMAARMVCLNAWEATIMLPEAHPCRHHGNKLPMYCTT